MKKNAWKKGFLATLMWGSIAGGATPAAVHGMVIFGGGTAESKLYASHVPMFHPPHDTQALLEISLVAEKGEGISWYRAKAFLNGKQKLMTLRPDPFVLPDLLSGKISSFRAALYEGNFEAGGKLILKSIRVEVNRILFQSPLLVSTAPGPLTYLILEGGYAVHLIQAPNSFDEIIQVSESESPGHKVFENVDDSVEQRWGITPGAFLNSFYCTLGPDFFSEC